MENDKHEGCDDECNVPDNVCDAEGTGPMRKAMRSHTDGKVDVSKGAGGKSRRKNL